MVLCCIRAALWLAAVARSAQASSPTAGAFNALYSLGCAAAMYFVSRRRPGGKPLATASLVRHQLTIAYAFLLQMVASIYFECARALPPRTACM